MKQKKKKQERGDQSYDDLLQFYNPNDLKINPDQLFEENMDHPNKTQNYVEAAADAEVRAKRAAERKKTIRSEIILAAKQEDPKLTDRLIEATYRADPRYQEATELQIEAERVKDILSQTLANMAFNKKSALENMVKLHYGAYYSEPSYSDGSIAANTNRQILNEEEE